MESRQKRDNDLEHTSREVRGKLPHAVIVGAPGLLPMLYRPTELAEDLHVPARTIREWTGKGMPHQRDRRGHIWINGTEFFQWVETMRQPVHTGGLGPNEAYCVRCNRPVQLVDPVLHTAGVSPLLQGSCPHCGATVNRGVRDDQ